MRVAGIDPGMKGAFWVMDTPGMKDGKILIRDLKYYVMPVDNGAYCLDDLVVIMNDICKSDVVVLENPHSIFGASKKSTWKLAHGVGVLTGILHSMVACYTLPRPKEWQKHVWKPEDLVFKPSSTGKTQVKDTKATSLKAFNRLFDIEPPKYGINEKVGRRRNPHDGIVDAALLSVYGLYEILKTTIVNEST